MNADDDDTLLGILLVPPLVPRVISDAVNSAEGPEIDNYHLAP
jgi:hypothetical protein